MRSSRLLRLLALFALVGLIAAGCGDDDGDESSDTTSGDTEETTGGTSEEEDIALVNDGSLTVCSDIPYAPFEFEDELTGDLSALATSEGEEDFIIVHSALTHHGVLGGLAWPLNRRSVVKIKRGPPACVLALDPAASAAVKFQGSTDVSLTGCVIASNSRADSSISRGGSALLTAACTSSVGGTYGGSSWLFEGR